MYAPIRNLSKKKIGKKDLGTLFLSPGRLLLQPELFCS